MHEDFGRAVEALAAIPYFPSAEMARAAIASELSSFCETMNGLMWIVTKAIAHMDRWSGMPELRGIYCSGGFTPLDGRIEQTKISALLVASEPEYYKPYKALLPEAPPSEEELEEFKQWAKNMDAKIKKEALEARLQSMLKSARSPQQPVPDWLKKIDGVD